MSSVRPDRAKTKWPDGLDDHGAAERLQSLLIDACEGRRDLSPDRAYKAIRKLMVRRPDLIDVVPQFVRTSQDLTTFWSYIRRISDHWQPRRDHVWKEFEPLFARVEGRTTPPVRSAAWTGRRPTRTASQQARIVGDLVPAAIDAVNAILDEQRLPLHNGGPADVERLEAIAFLEELHAELGTLLALAQTRSPLSEQLAVVRSKSKSFLRWTTEPYGLAIGRLPLAGFSLAMGVGIMKLVEVVAPGSGTAAVAQTTTAAILAAAAVPGMKANGGSG